MRTSEQPLPVKLYEPKVTAENGYGRDFIVRQELGEWCGRLSFGFSGDRDNRTFSLSAAISGREVPLSQASEAATLVAAIQDDETAAGLARAGLNLRFKEPLIKN